MKKWKGNCTLPCYIRDLNIWGIWYMWGSRIHLLMQETQETWVQSLGQEDLLKEKVKIYPSILAWTIPLTKKPGRLRFMGSQRVRHNWVTKHAGTRVLEWMPHGYQRDCALHSHILLIILCIQYIIYYCIIIIIILSSQKICARV